jgi:hypothetical protein
MSYYIANFCLILLIALIGYLIFGDLMCSGIGSIILAIVISSSLNEQEIK